MQTFRNNQFGEIRIVDQEGNPWFVAKDVAEILEYGQTSDMTKRLRNKYVGKLPSDLADAYKSSVNATKPLTIISEPGFYQAILGSKKEEALDFQDWVVEEVLPSIRKHGAYLTPTTLDDILEDPRKYAELINKLADERDAKREAIRAKEEAIKAKEEAIRTKAEIGSRREATSMATASVAIRKARALSEELGEAQTKAAIVKVQDILGLQSGKILKETGEKTTTKMHTPLGQYCRMHKLELQKISVANSLYRVTVYPAEAWKNVLGIDIKTLFDIKNPPTNEEIAEMREHLVEILKAPKIRVN